MAQQSRSLALPTQAEQRHGLATEGGRGGGGEDSERESEGQKTSKKYVRFKHTFQSPCSLVATGGYQLANQMVHKNNGL